MSSLRFLISYAYMNSRIEALLPELAGANPVLIDSGAFTAWRGGKVVDLWAYRDWLVEHGPRVWGYLNLDVIGDPVGSESNLRALRAASLDPIPVITRGMTLRQAIPLMDGTGRVAVGGLVGTPDKLGFLRSLAPALRGKRVHALGSLVAEVLKKSFVKTADASSWSSPLRYGTLTYHYRGRRHLLSRHHFTNVLSPVAASLLRETGSTAQELRGRWRNVPGPYRDVAFRLACLNAVRLEQQTGTEVFMAVTGADDIVAFLAAEKFLMERGLLK